MTELNSKFEAYFASVYSDRWPSLLQALQKPEQQVARFNNFSPPRADSKWRGHPEKLELPGCRWLPIEHGLQPERNQDELLDAYVLDPASVIVARALGVQEGDRVLDMCAAPGGKSLVLVEALISAGEIYCNDLSPDRRERLKKVIQQYIPRDVRNRVWVTGKDGVQFGLKEPESFDRILLDAPCSGERHLLENPSALAEWTPKRTEHLATRQYSLLSAAFLALKPGGTLVYSTCSISPIENDGPVQRLIKKKKGQAILAESQPLLVGEKTETGHIYLPDQAGFGPLYFSVIQKSKG